MINNLLFMNKILILLSLIYLISCKLKCFSIEDPANKEDCYNRDVENGAFGICCHIKYNSSFQGNNLSKCLEIDRTDIESSKESWIRVYSKLEMTIEEFSCPTKEKSDDSFNNVCRAVIDKANYKNCFNKTLVDEANNYCCFALLSQNGKEGGGCIELQKNISVYDMKQKLANEYSMFEMKIEDLKCPSNEEEKKNTFQGNTSNKGFYIKSGFALIFAFLF